MRPKILVGTGTALFVAISALSSLAFAQDQKAPSASPKADQPMMMPAEMMARMNKMMDMCEKMMSNNNMHKSMMRQHKQ